MALIGDFLVPQLLKKPTCNTGVPVSIAGLGRSPGEGICYPLQYSWASLVAQLVKNPPAMGGTWVRSLGCEDPLKKGKATHSSILAWRIPWTVQSTGSQRVRHDWATYTFTFIPVWVIISRKEPGIIKSSCHVVSGELSHHSTQSISGEQRNINGLLQVFRRFPELGDISST